MREETELLARERLKHSRRVGLYFAFRENFAMTANELERHWREIGERGRRQC